MEVASATALREKEAPPPSELVTPFTASAAPSTAAGALDQEFGAGLRGIFQIELGNVPGQAVGRGQAGEAVLRRQPGHGDGAAGQAGQGIGGEIGRGDEGHFLSHKDTQAQIVTLRPLDIFQLAQPVGDAGGDALDKKGVGGIGAGFAGGFQQGAENSLGIAFGGGHGFPMPQAAASVKGT